MTTNGQPQFAARTRQVEWRRTEELPFYSRQEQVIRLISLSWCIKNAPIHFHHV